MTSFGYGIETQTMNIVTVFIGGHGRVNEHKSVTLPHGVRVEWFGTKGNPVSKPFTAGILKGQIRSTAADVGGGVINEHYSCASSRLELELRSGYFQTGQWPRDRTYFVQAKTDTAVALSQIIRHFRTNYRADRYCFRWSVCRSSIHQAARLTHSFKSGVVGYDEKPAGGMPASAPKTVQADDIGELIYVEGVGRPLKYGDTADVVRATHDAVWKYC